MRTIDPHLSLLRKKSSFKQKKSQIQSCQDLEIGSQTYRLRVQFDCKTIQYVFFTNNDGYFLPIYNSKRKPFIILLRNSRRRIES